MSKLPTGSGVERGMACPASCSLARAGHTGDGATFGTGQHKEIEDGDTSRPVVRQVLENATEVRHEVAYALNVERRIVREIGVGIGRAYGPLDDAEIAMTVDIEALRPDGWWVGDWKSRSRVAAVESNWQIRCGVIAVMARHSADSVTGFLGYLDDSELEPKVFDAFHVAGWWEELRAMKGRIDAAASLVEAGGVPEVNAGTWCQYCPSLPYCPAHTRLALSMLGELEAVDKALAPLSAEQCGRAWELLKRYKTVADRVEKTIKARASRELVPLSNGRRLALVECKGRMSVDSEAVAAAFSELGREVPKKRGAPYVQVKEVKIGEEVVDV